ncbi:hypothetical protein [Staphylococcus phage PT1-4]
MHLSNKFSCNVLSPVPIGTSQCCFVYGGLTLKVLLRDNKLSPLYFLYRLQLTSV